MIAISVIRADKFPCSSFFIGTKCSWQSQIIGFFLKNLKTRLKVEELAKDGFDVRMVEHKTTPNKENKEYLDTKAKKMDHEL